MFGLLTRSFETRASLDNPVYTIDDLANNPELFGGGGEADSGIRVTHEKGLTLDPVWQAIQMISGDIAKLPLDLFARGEDGGRDVDSYHPAWYLVAREANEFLSSMTFWERILFHALLWGNGYAWIERNGRGDPIGLYNLLPDRTGPVVVDGQLYYETETEHRDGTPWLPKIRAENVYNLQGPGYETWQGVDPCELARNSWGLSLANQKFTSRFYKHGVRTSGILQLPTGMTPKAAEELEKKFHAHHNSDEGWFKTVVLRDGAQFHQTSVKPNEAQNTEQMEQGARNAARRFNISPSLLGVADAAGYGTKEQDTQSYLDRTLSPWMRRIITQAYCKLLSKRQKLADSHYFEHNTGALLTMNMLTRYQVYALGLRNKILVPNEARAMENMNPMPGGEKPLEAYGKGAAGTAGDNQTNQHTGDNPAGGDPSATVKDQGKTAPPSKSTRMRFLYKLTERARNKSHRSKAYCEWLEGGLTTFIQDAQRVGMAAEKVIQFRDALNAIADLAKSDEQLETLVDQAATEFEEANTNESG